MATLRVAHAGRQPCTYSPDTRRCGIVRPLLVAQRPVLVALEREVRAGGESGSWSKWSVLWRVGRERGGTYPAAGTAWEAPACAAAWSQAPARPHHARVPPAPRAPARVPPRAHHALWHAPSQDPTAESPPHRPSNLHTVRVCGRGEQAAIPVATRHSLSPQGEGQGAPPPINTRQGLLHAAWMHKLCYSRCHSRNLPTMWREGKSQCPRAHM